MNPETRSYEAAYAFYAPIMRRRWRHSNSAKRHYAAADILDTMRLHSWGPYMGKLYAELDAIRDAEHEYERRLARQGRKQ